MTRDQILGTVFNDVDAKGIVFHDGRATMTADTLVRHAVDATLLALGLITRDVGPETMRMSDLSRGRRARIAGDDRHNGEVVSASPSSSTPNGGGR